MSKFIDLEGFRFGRLIVLKRMETNSNGKVTWLCRVDVIVVQKKLLLEKVLNRI